ncbi:alkaline-phosphatase-like protein [Fennellomyces sp. T-0311]|nr:alkaline-phosphatase-like protein [Fennellomyces sp. T-0311]
MWRYPLLAVFFGMFLLMFKVVLIIVLHSEIRERGPDRVLFNGTEYFGPTVILISLDGFRNDYLARNVTPNLLHFAANGMRAEYMHPAFPSITFPNHWTMATGLHPESHGIVANEFYDPALKKEFSIMDDDKRWWDGEPIWMTAKRQEKESAVIMWPGSMITGLKPGRVIPFNDTTSPREKIDLALEWVDLPRDDRPNLISVYIQQVDEGGHRHGPTGSDIDKTIADMDDAIGYLWQGLDNRNLIGRIHVVIVSDHGMAETDRSRVIYYDDILSKQSLGWLAEREAGPLLGLRPKPDAPKHAVKQIYQELHDYTQKHEDAHFQVYLREDVPARLHYSNNERIAPIVAIPDVGYVMIDHDRWHPKSPTEQFSPRGIHGYDNLAPEMRSIFMAHGPTVDMEYGRHAILAPFYNTEVYGFVCELLNIDPGPHNGTMDGQFIRIR